MKKLGLVLLLVLAIALCALPLGCAGAYVGVSVPVGNPYGGWGPSVGVGVAVPIGRPGGYY